MPYVAHYAKQLLSNLKSPPVTPYPERPFRRALMQGTSGHTVTKPVENRKYEAIWRLTFL